MLSLRFDLRKPTYSGKRLYVDVLGRRYRRLDLPKLMCRSDSKHVYCPVSVSVSAHPSMRHAPFADTWLYH